MPPPNDKLYGLTAEDVRTLKALIIWANGMGLNARGRFTKERQHAEGEDQMAPEVYVGKAPSDGIPPITLASQSTGTGDTSYDEPGVTNCDLYDLSLADNPHDLRPIGTDIKVHNISAGKLTGWIIAIRTKFGRWVCIPIGVPLVRVCLAEQHPGYDIVFTAYLGEWDPDTDSWYYGESAEDATLVYCIDFLYSSDGTNVYPGTGATGLALAQPSKTYDTIYEIVTMDCNSPGSCFGSTGTGTAT